MTKMGGKTYSRMKLIAQNRNNNVCTIHENQMRSYSRNPFKERARKAIHTAVSCIILRAYYDPGDLDLSLACFRSMREVFEKGTYVIILSSREMSTYRGRWGEDVYGILEI